MFKTFLKIFIFNLKLVLRNTYNRTVFQKIFFCYIENKQEQGKVTFFGQSLKHYIEGNDKEFYYICGDIFELSRHVQFLNRAQIGKAISRNPTVKLIYSNVTNTEKNGNSYDCVNKLQTILGLVYFNKKY